MKPPVLGKGLRLTAERVVMENSVATKVETRLLSSFGFAKGRIFIKSDFYSEEKI